MNIRDIFIELTRETYPHGYESELIKFLPKSAVRDEMGNYSLEIGEGNTYAFTSHLDTAGRDKVYVEHVFEGNLVKTSGKSILGADDKAGMSLMLWLIDRGFPGIYYFFVGEEVGCKGSRYFSQKHIHSPNENLSKIISLDRRGTSSVITHQTRQRTASDIFSQALCDELNKNGLNYRIDTNGFSTDSLQFSSIYPECTNLSVGYQNEHTTSEYQDLAHLENLAYALSRIDFNQLPVDRDPKKYDYLPYTYTGYNNYSYSPPLLPPKKELVESKYFWDKKFRRDIRVDKYLSSGKIQSIKLCRERLSLEKELIEKFLGDIEVEYTEMKWDGLNLVLKSYDEISQQIDRTELSEFIPDLNFYLN
jgi:hypothetical protein